MSVFTTHSIIIVGQSNQINLRIFTSLQNIGREEACLFLTKNDL